jgi:hypothetical protein
MNVNRRSFLTQAGAAYFSLGFVATPALAADSVSAIDRERMRSVAAFTAETLSTDHPVPFGGDIVSTATGERLMRAVNRVGPDHDPSAHAETLTIRRSRVDGGRGLRPLGLRVRNRSRAWRHARPVETQWYPPNSQQLSLKEGSQAWVLKNSVSLSGLW